MDQARPRSAADHSAVVGLEALEQRLAMSVVAWVGGGGNNLWSNPLNWDGGAVPGSTSDVSILNEAASIAVIADIGPIRIRSLTLDERLVINRGVAVSVSGRIDLGSSSDLRINGLLNWASGDWEDGAIAAINAGGTLNIGSTTTPTIGSVAIGADVRNFGTFAWRGGAIDLSGSITNGASKAMDVASPRGISGEGLITNFGVIRRGGLALGSTTIDTDLNNAGHVRVLRGTLAVGTPDATPPFINNQGEFSTVVARAAVRFRAPALHRDASFVGPGSYHFSDFTQILRGEVLFARATFEASAPVYVDPGGARLTGSVTLRSSLFLEASLRVDGRLVSEGAPIEGPFTVTVGGALTLTGGQVASEVSVLSGGTLSGIGDATISADVRSEGTIVLGSGSRLSISGSLRSTGVVDTTITTAQFGRVTVAGNLILGGTLVARFVGGGFTEGSTFGVLAASGSRWGTFPSFVPLGVVDPFSASVMYLPGGATLGLV